MARTGRRGGRTVHRVNDRNRPAKRHACTMSRFCLVCALVSPPALTAHASDPDPVARARELDAHGDPVQALDLLEGAAHSPAALERRNAALLLDAIGSLHAPGAEPGWYYVGVPMLAAGALGAIGTSAIEIFGCLFSCYRDETPYYTAYGIEAVVGGIGLILCIIGLLADGIDPDRAAFEQRRRPLVRAIRRGVLTGQLSFSF
jgi:hypothetical protein